MVGSFLKKKKKKICQVVENIYGYWKNMYVDLYMWEIWPLARCKCSIENVIVGMVVEFEKKWLLERNDKERLKNNILIKWYWKCECWNSC